MSNWQDNDFIMKAYHFAEEKHRGDRRKFSDKDYFSHPLNVMLIADKILPKNHPHHKEILAAALLHDTIEDTDTTFHNIKDFFSEHTASLVKQLTNEQEPKQKLGKKVYIARHSLEMDDEALFIKLCDRLDNISGWKLGDEKYIQNYYQATRYLIDYLSQHRDFNDLQNRLVRLIEKHLSEIKNYLDE